MSPARKEMSSTTSIKLALKQGAGAPTEVVRLPFTQPVTLDAVKTVVARQWGLASGTYDLAYVDDTEETIRLGDVDEGLAEALLHHAGPLLKITVTPKAAAGERKESSRKS
jgi:hypothetical protein